MKIVAICDDWETSTSLRLAGIESFEVSIEEFSTAFDKASSDDETAIILISKAFTHLYENQNFPLIMEL